MLVLLLVVMAACGSDEGETQNGGDEATEQTVEIAGAEANDHGTMEIGMQADVRVGAGDLFFDPTVLSGDAGQTVTVRVANEGEVDHTFTLSDQDVDVVLRPGEEGDAEVTFPDAGALVFVCRFHEGAGMRGGLSVGGDLSPAASDGGGPGAPDEDGAPDDGGGGYEDPG